MNFLVNYIYFEYEGIPAVGKMSRFTEEEKLNGFYFYDLRHFEDDFSRPATIENNVAVNYYGSIMTKVPLPLNEMGFIALYDESAYQKIADAHEKGLTDDEIRDIEIDFLDTLDDFISDLHFFDRDVENADSLNARQLKHIWEMIKPHPYKKEDLTMDRKWAMPNKNTFNIKPVKELLTNQINGGFVIDPFANENKWAHLTNDLNERFDTNYHLDALEFLKQFDDESVDVVLFDPPYSPRQIKEAYESVGLDTQGGTLTRSSFWTNMKKEIARILRVNGKVVSFGWNSMGMGNQNIFHKNHILLVPHGGAHNDTIITVEVKTKNPSLVK